MKKDRYTGLGVSAVVIALLMTFYGYITISGDFVTHFAASGEPGGSMNKISGLLFVPGLMIAMYGFFRILPKIDPLEQNYRRFKKAYRGIMASILGFLAYIQAVLVLWNVGFAFNIVKALIPAIAVLFYIFGDFMQRAEQNWFIGIRTPWTLSSEAVWKETHDTAAVLFKSGSFVVISALAFPSQAIALIAGTAFLIGVFSFIYSYMLYRRQE